MSARRTLPTGRLERVVQLARVGAGTGLGLVTGKSTSRLAEQATDVLASMRGLAAKAGQMASTLDGLLPESLEAPYAKAMARLRDHTATSAYSAIAAIIHDEFGAPVGTLFREFECEPTASASIGQVHRAILPSGQLAAVKVQHPGIDAAIESDLSNARLVERMAGALIPSGLGADQAFDEAATRFREELDYRLEARRQQHFAKLHSSAPAILIPPVVESHCSRRVLTTHWVEGRTLETTVAQASESERRGFAETLWRFVFRSILVGGVFNADPHPGNFLFGESPQISFLDFGCVQELSQPRKAAAIAAHAAAIRRDESGFALAMRQLLATKPGAFESIVLEFARKTFEPLFNETYRIKKSYLRQLFAFARDSKTKVYRARDSVTPFPPELALLNRLQFGFYSLLAKLDVEVDYARIEREILAEG